MDYTYLKLGTECKGEKLSEQKNSSDGISEQRKKGRNGEIGSSFY